MREYLRIGWCNGILVHQQFLSSQTLSQIKVLLASNDFEQWKEWVLDHWLIQRVCNSQLSG